MDYESLIRTQAQQPSIATENRRSSKELKMSDDGLIKHFPTLKIYPEGAARAKETIKEIIRKFSDTDVERALVGHRARHISTGNGTTPTGHYIINPVPNTDKSVHDGRFFLEAYSNGRAMYAIDAKDTLFAIRREALKQANTNNPKLKELCDLASLAIFNIQHQRKMGLN